MATANTKYTYALGKKAITTYHTLWDSTSNHSGVTVIDLSADADSSNTNSIRIDRVYMECTAGIDAKLLFDATSDEQFVQTILGSTTIIDVDFTFGGRPGIVPTASGATGDVLVTTTSAASADEMLLIIWWGSD
jgi:hypothetical protein